MAENIPEPRKKIDIGFDFDGVIAFRKTLKPKTRPPDGEEYVIISSRPPEDVGHIMMWCLQYGYKAFGIACTGKMLDGRYVHKGMHERKAEAVSAFGLKRFHDDEPNAVEAIRKRVPNCEVVLVPHGEDD